MDTIKGFLRNLMERLKRSWFFVFAFIPFMQWLTCFMMNGRRRNKKWVMMGFAYIAIFTIIVLLGSYASSYSYSHRVIYPEGPDETEYQGFTYDDFRVNGSIDWDAYDVAYDEYAKSDAKKAYDKAYKEYIKTPEYKEADSANQRVSAVSDGLETVSSTAGVLTWLIYFILIFFIERYNFLNGHEEISTRRQVAKRLSSTTTSNGTKKITKTAAKASSSEVSDRKVANEASNIAQTAPVGQLLNVNTATEAELESLAGVSVIDVKKIVSYRQIHGGFSSLDEFFESFNAKPHIIVRLSDKLEVSSKQKAETVPQGVSAKPRFDI